MSENKYVALGNVDVSTLKFNNYSCPAANSAIYCKTIVPKNNDNIWNSVDGEWQINDEWDVTFLSDKKIRINKFRIDTWGLRKIFNTGNSNDTDAATRTDFLNLPIKVSGLEYVHNNVVFQEDTDGNKTYGFTKAYCGTGGYNVYWYPGQFTSGKYIQGLGIQGGIGYTANSNERDDGLLMGKHPWGVGETTQITDGYMKGKWFDGSFRAITIGLYGGYQTATAWHDYEGTAYKIYDISDNPIIIDLDVENTNVPIDPSSVECWNMYVGNNVAFQKTKTVENCWLKYGFLTNEYYTDTDNKKVQLGENSKMYTLVNKCEDFINEPKTRQIYTPIVSDWKSLFTPKYVALSGTYDEETRVSDGLTNPGIDVFYYSELDDGTYQLYKCSNKTWVVSETKDTEVEYSLLIKTQKYYSHQIKLGVKCIFEHTYNSETQTLDSVEVSEIPTDALELNSPALYVANDINYYVNIVYTLDKDDIVDSVASGGIRWQCSNYNEQLWDEVKNFYTNEYKISESGLLDCAFRKANISGELTLHLDYDHGFGYGHGLLEGSQITDINFVVHNNTSRISSMNRLFRGASSLTGITVSCTSNPTQCLCGAYDLSGAFERGCKLATYPSNLIDWSVRANFQWTLGGTSTCGYIFDGNGYIQSLPICIVANGDRFHDSNLIVPNYAQQMFNGCSSLTYVGPVIDMAYLKPEVQFLMFKGCSNLTDIRLNRINHGDWRFDNSAYSNGNTIGSLPSLDEESISYLLANAYDLQNADQLLGAETASNAFAPWYRYVPANNAIGSATYASCSFKYAYYRLPSLPLEVEDLVDPQDDGSFLISTTSTITNMEVVVSGLDSTNWLWFGSLDMSAGVTILSNGTTTLNKVNTDTWGFILFTTDVANKGYMVNRVSISIKTPCDQTIPSITTATIYCPSEWEGKIKDEDLASVKAKGWTVMLGGVEL